MIKRILVPIDYSEASINAFETAVNIAERNSALLYILHVRDTISNEEESYPKEKINGVSDAMAGRMLIQRGVQLKVIFAEGLVGHVIIKTIQENKIDLVIMGTHGTSGFREYFIGSNAYYTIKRSGCPVLLIPEEGKWLEFDKILFPIRPAAFSFKLYQFIDDVIRQNINHSNIQILDISTDSFEKSMPGLSSMVQELRNKSAYKNTDITFRVSKNINIPDSVLSVADEIKADLIIISPGVDVASKPFFIGPFTQRIINHSKIPVLSILKTNAYQFHSKL